MTTSLRRLRPLAVAALTTLAAAAPARAESPPALPTHVPGEVVVTYDRDAAPAARAEVQRRTGLAAARTLTDRTRVLRVRPGASLAATLRELRADPHVAAAAPNPVAHIAAAYPAYYPDDPGTSGIAGGWASEQWNFAGPYGVQAPQAWANLVHAGHPGGRGVTVAVLDTGVAYADYGRFVRSPDFRPSHFVAPYDFVGHDSHPNDENGHGTHVAGTINEATGNDVSLTGLAYGASVMPVRVLDRFGDGDSATISEGVRYAVRHGADVINLSFVFDGGTSTRDVPDLLSALSMARRAGVLVVAASGNDGQPAVAYPARASSVLAVGATTEHGCEARYSNSGSTLDLVAPGGGKDARLSGDPRCHPGERSGRSIPQLTFTSSVRRFGIPRDYVGTSMAAPHVAATAALVIASGVIGAHPSPAAIERRLKATAQPLGSVRHYGSGLLDAAAATAR